MNMANNHTLAATPEGPSARLNRLLDNIGFTPKGKGRGAQFTAEFSVSVSTATRWLAKDELPSDPTQAKKVRDVLNTSLDYWYFGYESSLPYEQVSLAFECAVIVHRKAHDKGLDSRSLPDSAFTQVYRMVYSNALTKGGMIDHQYVDSIITLLLDLRAEPGTRS
jgi:hypothetical protein